LKILFNCVSFKLKSELNLLLISMSFSLSISTDPLDILMSLWLALIELIKDKLLSILKLKLMSFISKFFFTTILIFLIEPFAL